VSDNPIIPIGYVQAKAPLYKKREINEYTPEGRKAIHKHLEAVNMSILHYLMRTPLKYASIELNVNRLSLYCSQRGKCSVTKQLMEFNKIHCHHKTSRKSGGTDCYVNLVLVSEDVHTLIHATDNNIIRRYLFSLKLNRDQIRKLNTLRKKAGVPEIVK